MLNVFYTYVMSHPITHKPFYVGKGNANRMMHHFYQRRRCKNPSLKRVLLEIDSLGLKPIYEKILYNVNESVALLKEIETISLLGRLDLGTGPLCNLTGGGEQGSSSWSPQTRERKSLAELAKQKGRPVTQYQNDGTFISHFPSAKVASENVTGANRSYITQCCKGRRKSAGGFIWTYKDSPQPCQLHKSCWRKVQQSTITNEFIAVFFSLTEAQRCTGIELHNISECCRGNSNSAGGFIWQYV